MAEWYSQATGNFDAWSGAASLIWFDAYTGGNAMAGANFAAVDTTGDTFHANSYTITINVDISVTQIDTLAGTGGSATGGFACSTARTITADIKAGTTTCLTFTGTNAATINAKTSAGILGSQTTSNADGIKNTNAAALTIVSNITGGSGSATAGQCGLRNSSTGALNITGNITGGGAQYGSALGVSSISGHTTVNGNILSGATTRGFDAGGGGILTLIGNIIGNYATGTAIGGRYIYTPAATNYIQHPYESGGTAYKYGKTVVAAYVIESITGTGADDPAAGTYHEATTAEVQEGVTFGAASALTGTYVGAGGGGVLLGSGALLK